MPQRQCPEAFAPILSAGLGFLLSTCVLAVEMGSELRPFSLASGANESAGIRVLDSWNPSEADELPTADGSDSFQIRQASSPQSHDCEGWCWCGWELDAHVRGFYLNDQRIQWSGNEVTFGAEAMIAPRVIRDFGTWHTSAEGEIYLNQTFDHNVLIDTPERVSYRANFDVPPFEISQLFVSATRGNWGLTMGKFETPFGRTYFPLYTNARLDAPFIRSECILWRETGIRGQYSRGLFVADVALVNGGENGDTNSSKGLISRLGIEGEQAALGFSLKVQDGIGSETQKQYNNHIGIDAMVRWHRFTLSGEAIHDEYGFRRPGFDPLDITWGRSIYYRDQNYRLDSPVTGTGYYVDLLYDRPPFSVSLNYGEYFPRELGIAEHDVVQRRAIIKGAYAVTPSLQFHAACILESDGYTAQAGRPRRGWVALFGIQWTL